MSILILEKSKAQNCRSVTAPSLALLTNAAYFASTPRR
jgi:hypothetical protein